MGQHRQGGAADVGKRIHYPSYTPRHPAQAGEDFIFVGAGRSATSPKADGVTHHLDLGADHAAARQSADIQGDQIHRNPPRNGHAPAAMAATPLLDKGARDAVGISERDGGDHAGPFCAERGCVANAFA
jgi:hypothetical protein